MAFYLGLLSLFLFTKQEVRVSIKNLIKTLANKYLLTSILCYLGYLTIWGLILNWSGFLELRLSKNLALWLLLNGLWLPISSTLSDPKANPIKDLIRKSFRIVVILSFISSTSTFSLGTEMILTPILILFAGLEAFSAHEEEHRQVHKFFQVVNIILSLIILFLAFSTLIQNYQSTDFPFLLKRFSLPIILTFISIPFLYLIMIYSAYEQLFLRVTVRTKIPRLQKMLRKQLLSLCGANLRKIRLITYSQAFNSSVVNTRREIVLLGRHLQSEIN